MVLWTWVHVLPVHHNPLPWREHWALSGQNEGTQVHGLLEGVQSFHSWGRHHFFTEGAKLTPGRLLSTEEGPHVVGVAVEEEASWGPSSPAFVGLVYDTVTWGSQCRLEDQCRQYRRKAS